MINEKEKSITKTISAIIKVATNTTIALDCNSGHVGHVVLCTNSLYDSFTYVFNPIVLLLIAGAEGLEPSTNGFGDHYSTN